MYRKILGICMALAALAVVLPAAASASLTLEDTSGGTTVSLPAGSKIKAISEGTSLFTGSNGVNVECNENFLTSEVVTNSGTKVEATITAGEFQSNLSSEGTLCKSGIGPMQMILPVSAAGTHWCIESVTGKDEFIFAGRNCGAEGAGTLSFVTIFHTIFGHVECHYSRSAAIGGTFTTETATHEAATLSMAGEPEFSLEEGSSTCAASWTFKTLNFKLYTDKGTGWDDAESTANPVWISDRA